MKIEEVESKYYYNIMINSLRIVEISFVSPTSVMHLFDVFQHVHYFNIYSAIWQNLLYHFF